jgi:hypothetical protein
MRGARAEYLSQSPTFTGATAFARKTFRLFVMVILLCGLSLSSLGCVKLAKNIESMDELEGRKVLAGRFVIYEGDKTVKPDPVAHETLMYKEGECESCRLSWDSEGYIYTPVTEGLCQFHAFHHLTTFGTVFSFDPDIYPAVVVDPNDSIVNFGTIELHFHQSTLSHVSEVVLGVSRASFHLDYVPDHDVTRADLIEKLGVAEEQIRDVNVVWLKRHDN